MQNFINIISDPYVAAAIALVILLISILPLLKKRKDPAVLQQQREREIRELALEKLRGSNSLQMLEMREADVLLIMDILKSDGVKLEGKYKRAAQHIQKAAHDRNKSLLSEDQITAVLVAYQQSQNEHP